MSRSSVVGPAGMTDGCCTSGADSSVGSAAELEGEREREGEGEEVRYVRGRWSGRRE